MSELLELASRVAGWARDGEDVEVYVSRGTETEVRVYEGDVESLSSATSAGAGVRVVVGRRQGFAYAGSLGEDVLAETLAEARDNASFASPRPGSGCPSRTVSALSSWTDGVTSWQVSRRPPRSMPRLDLERCGARRRPPRPASGVGQLGRRL